AGRRPRSAGDGSTRSSTSLPPRPASVGRATGADRPSRRKSSNSGPGTGTRSIASCKEPRSEERTARSSKSCTPSGARPGPVVTLHDDPRVDLLLRIESTVDRCRLLRQDERLASDGLHLPKEGFHRVNDRLLDIPVPVDDKQLGPARERGREGTGN